MTTQEFELSVARDIQRILSKAKPLIYDDDPMSRDKVNALCKAHGFATLDEQEQYWKVRDKDLDRIESNAQWIDERDRDLEHESRVDYETWQTDTE